MSDAALAVGGGAAVATLEAGEVIAAGAALAVAAAPVIAAIAIGAAIGVGIGILLSKAHEQADKDHSDKAPSATNQCPETGSKTPEIADQKQDGHVKGTPQNKNRLKQGKPTSTFNGTREEADQLTQEAWEKGKPVPGRPNVREHDFERPVGTGPNGGSQTRVRVHQDTEGRIHGHPAGPEQGASGAP